MSAGVAPKRPQHLAVDHFRSEATRDELGGDEERCQEGDGAEHTEGDGDRPQRAVGLGGHRRQRVIRVDRPGGMSCEISRSTSGTRVVPRSVWMPKVKAPDIC